MTATRLYNENDPYAARWLRNLIAAGQIADGVVDERSIAELDPDYVRRFIQCHFFAGIGVWSYALRLAGVSDDRPLWTGSCPCQPFSNAGKGKGHEDERHLWPTWRGLIRECRPPVVLGEQVAGADGLAWLDVVLTDLEDDHHAVAAADLSAAGAGAPHIRQRLFFVAHARRERGERDRLDLGSSAGGGRREAREQRIWPDAGHGGDARALADDHGSGRDQLEASRVHGRRPGACCDAAAQGDADGSLGHDSDGRCKTCGVATGAGSQGRGARRSARSWDEGSAAERGSSPRGLADADGPGAARLGGERGPSSTEGGLRSGSGDRGVLDHAAGERLDGRRGLFADQGEPTQPEGRRASFWSDAEWVACRDGKARPIEPGTFPLAHGATARVGRLRGYGNAIVAPLAAAFIEAALTS